MKKSVLIITPGDPDGIGPEVTWKAIRSGLYQKKGITVLCVGAAAPFKKLKAPIVLFDSQRFNDQQPPPSPRSKKPFVWLLPAPEEAPEGRLLAGFQSGWSIEQATRLVLNGFASAIVTGPISKERLQQGGYPYPGHTEFLAALCQPELFPRPLDVTMMLANSQLRISLVTTHLGIHQVSQALTREKLRRAISHTAEGLSHFWKIKKPRIAIAALNPHGGESGLFGREEIEIIEPEIRSLQETPRLPYEISGPFPADTLFAKHLMTPKKKRFDAIVCMYHDQGLIPVKLLDFPRTVNVTLGLPIIRTSVDHGVGFDIAGKGVADPSSLCAALELATQFVQNQVLKKRRLLK